MFPRMGGFLQPIGHFERIKTVISVTEGIERDERNSPLQENGYLAISPLKVFSAHLAFSRVSQSSAFKS